MMKAVQAEDAVPGRNDANLHGERCDRSLWADQPEGKLITLPLAPSVFEQLGRALRGPKPAPLEMLSVRIEVEPSAINYAHVYVVATMLSGAPREQRLAVFSHPDSAPVEELTTTATMGNYELPSSTLAEKPGS